MQKQIEPISSCVDMRKLSDLPFGEDNHLIFGNEINEDLMSESFDNGAYTNGCDPRNTTCFLSLIFVVQTVNSPPYVAYQYPPSCNKANPSLVFNIPDFAKIVLPSVIQNNHNNNSSVKRQVILPQGSNESLLNTTTTEYVDFEIDSGPTSTSPHEPDHNHDHLRIISLRTNLCIGTSDENKVTKICLAAIFDSGRYCTDLTRAAFDAILTVSRILQKEEETSNYLTKELHLDFPEIKENIVHLVHILRHSVGHTTIDTKPPNIVDFLKQSTGGTHNSSSFNRLPFLTFGSSVAHILTNPDVIARFHRLNIHTNTNSIPKGRKFTSQKQRKYGNTNDYLYLFNRSDVKEYKTLLFRKVFREKEEDYISFFQKSIDPSVILKTQLIEITDHLTMNEMKNTNQSSIIDKKRIMADVLSSIEYAISSNLAFQVNIIHKHSTFRLIHANKDAFYFVSLFNDLILHLQNVRNLPISDREEDLKIETIVFFHIISFLSRGADIGEITFEINNNILINNKNSKSLLLKHIKYLLEFLLINDVVEEILIYYNYLPPNISKYTKDIQHIKKEDIKTEIWIQFGSLFEYEEILVIYHICHEINKEHCPNDLLEYILTFICFYLDMDYFGCKLQICSEGQHKNWQPYWSLIEQGKFSEILVKIIK